MGDISFNSIPVDIRVPGAYLEIDNENAVQGLTGMPVKVLVIGQKLAAGTATALVPYLITTVDQAEQLFGSGSQLAHMMEKFKTANSFVEVWAIAQVDNGGGTAAAGNIVFSGPATAAGTLALWIGGRLTQIAVAAADTASTVATNVAAALTTNLDLAVTAAVDGMNPAKIVLTARHKGVEGTALDVRFNYYQDQTLPAGIGAAITAMTGGAGNPDVTAAIAALGNVWYTDIVMAYQDTTNLVAMETELATRFGPMKMIDGHVYVGASDTLSNLVTKGDARNSPHSSIIGAYKSPTPPYEWAAAFGAVCAYYLQIDPARPVQTLATLGILPPAQKDQFTLDERNILLHNGISTFHADDSGAVSIERMVTTYQKNPFGAADISYLDLETMKTLAYLRYDVRTFIALRYPRYKLADDGTDFAVGQAVVTPSVIRASLIARFVLWMENGLVENLAQFKADLIVKRNGTDPNRVDAIIPPDIINQMRVFAGALQYRL